MYARVAFHRRNSNLAQKISTLGLFIPFYCVVVTAICTVTAPDRTSALSFASAMLSGLLKGYRRDRP